MIVEQVSRATKAPRSTYRLLEGGWRSFPSLVVESCGLGHQELRGVYRLIHITTLIAIDADPKISIVVFRHEKEARVGFCNARSNQFYISVLKAVFAWAIADHCRLLMAKARTSLAIARQVIVIFCQQP